MAFETVLLEVLGVVVIAGAAFAVTCLVSITPYDYSYSREHNRAIFCGIPLAVYVAYRLYFGICFFISSKIPASLKSIQWYLSTLLVSGGITGALFILSVQPTLWALYDYYIGDVYKAVYAVSEPELIKAYAFGLRVLALVAACFVALFAVELVVRLVLLLLVTLLRGVGLMKKTNGKEGKAGSVSKSGSASDLDNGAESAAEAAE